MNWFSSATGEGWQEIMYSCGPSARPKCDGRSRSSKTEDCGSYFAIPYFLSFYILCSFLVRFYISKKEKTYFDWLDYQFICCGYYG